MALTIGRKDFPEGFEFGVATAAYQIEGTSNGVVGPSHWDSFAATQGNVFRAQDGSVACDHYNRFEADLDLVSGGNFDTYRFSTAWTRVMPDGRTVNAEGLDFYDRLVDATLARGLKPSLTLYHWELPETFADLGGWSNRDTALAFGDYARVVMDRLGDRVGAVATINEPWCIAWLSHFHGGMAPGIRNIRTAARAMHHILLAHGVGMQAIRDSGTHADAGIVLNFAWPATVTEAARRIGSTASTTAGSSRRSPRGAIPTTRWKDWRGICRMAGRTTWRRFPCRSTGWG